MSRHAVTEIKHALSDPTRVLEALGLMGEGRARMRQSGGWLIRCPVHEDGTPSCSVQQRDGVLLWKCHGCVGTDELLLTPDGLLTAGHVVREVFSHTGWPTAVVDRSTSTQDVVRVRATNNRVGTVVTPDHRMLYVTAPVTQHSLERFGWDGVMHEARADQLPHDAWLPFVIPEQQRFQWRIKLDGVRTWKKRPRSNEIDGYDVDFCWVIGLYAAEGSIQHGRAVTFTVHRNEAAKLIERLQRVAAMFGARVTVHERPRSLATDLVISSASFARLIDRLVGRGCDRKVCPAELLFGPIECAASWLEGLYVGDGCKSGRRAISLCSRELIYASFVIAARCHALPRLSTKARQAGRRPAWTILFAGRTWRDVLNAAKGLPVPAQVLRKSEAVVRMRDGTWILCSKLRTIQDAGRSVVIDLSTKARTFSLASLTVHNCDASGDVLHLIALTRGLKVERDFKTVLLEGAKLGGLWQLVEELQAGTDRQREERAPDPEPVLPPAPVEPPREWPPREEIELLWSSCVPTCEDDVVATHLRARSLDPEVIDARDLARALPARGALPRWAVCRGGSWREVGYKLIIPMFDVTGDMRGVRCWRVVDGEGPKRRPPFGHKASELVMVDSFARAMLRGEFAPYRVVIVEGEPDFLTRASVANDPHMATIGIINGSWTDAFAQRLPVGARVAIRTHEDDAGDRYAQEIARSVRRRCFVWRSQSGAST